MRVRLAIVSWFVGCVLAMNTVVLADPHPVCNKLSTKRAWQIEYDENFPRDGNYAVRLIIPETENTVTTLAGKVKLSGCTLYRFNFASGNYVKKNDVDGGKVVMAGYVDLAPERGTGNAYWSKKSMRLDLTGTYTDGGGKVKIVYAVGALHPGNKNKKTGRDDYRLTLHIYEVVSTDALLKALDKLYSAQGNDSNALQDFRKLFLDGIPCDEQLPADATAESSYMDPTMFPYTPHRPGRCDPPSA